MKNARLTTNLPPSSTPCVRSKRPRVYRHHAHTCFNMCAWCRYKRGRFGRTHGDVLSGHAGFFSVSHHTTHHTHTTTQDTTQHDTPQHSTATRPHNTPQHTTTHHNTPQHTTTHHNTPQHNMTHHNTPQQHDRNNTRRQRDRERERQRKKTEDKTRQDNRRERERRFIFSVVVHGRSLLMECFFWLIPFARETCAC